MAVRRPAARPQPRHGRRHELRAVAARRADGRARGAVELQPRRRRPLQGRLHHAPLRPAGTTTCTRCSSRWCSATLHGRDAAACPSRRPTRRGRTCSRCCARCCRRCSTGAPMAADGRPAVLWAPLAWIAGGWRRASCCCASTRDGHWSEVARRRRRAARRRRTCSPARCCPASSTRTATRSSAPSPAWPNAATRRATTSGRWRDRMYARRLRVTPEQLRAIAAHLYVELLRGGYTQVCEFHYLRTRPRRQRRTTIRWRCRWRSPTPPPTPASA